ncbi:flavin-containing monooxygenase [Paenibacillus lemnae]|uniref:NAD(P)-binding domain-containing protein n=1 Tax=Paenibacillus lemnae TaxID=1330551 RepID=A0A848MAM5_PAELE|nr:NAD(P)/FAD-dependent oxidoreductase [Paenibacillus lemnae]NMO97122.1 NAD(P)-binding domain-containing protein [Paenibacillus lemnae]
MQTNTDVLIIGAGQAGLAAAYYLNKSQVNFLLIGQEQRIGDVWRQRYDSLVTFTPRAYNALPGLPLEGDPDGFSSKDEIADYLERYAAYSDFPVQLGTKVHAVDQEDDGLFRVTTSSGVIHAEKIIVAAGPFQKPWIPSFANQLSRSIHQIHTSQYINTSSLQEGPVLIVGAGNSGAQIAVELSKEREVYLSAGHKMKFLPLQLMGKSIFWWFDKTGILSATVDSKAGRWIRGKGDPIFGSDLIQAIRSGRVMLKPRSMKVQQDVFTFEDGTVDAFPNIIWATGFRSDYSWMQVPGILDAEGKPIHQRGASPVRGLYFLGLPWQSRRGSALIGGVARDAEVIVRSLQ